MKGPIVEEIHQARDAHAKQFNYDMDAICDDLRKREKDSGVPTVSLATKRTQKTNAFRKRTWQRPDSRKNDGQNP